MRQAVLLVPVVLLAAACGGNDTGFFAFGALQASYADPVTGGRTETGFRFERQTRIEPTLPSRADAGVTGSCRFGSDGRTLQLTAVGGEERGVREATITLVPWSQADCDDCRRGQIDLNVGGTTFTGVDDRRGASSVCTFTTERQGSSGMSLTARCTGLTATGDPRRIDVSGTLTLEACDGPDAR